MKKVLSGKNAQGRSTFQVFTYHLLVDILPTLLLLATMAFGMALVSSKLPHKSLFTGSNTPVEKVS